MYSKLADFHSLLFSLLKFRGGRIKWARGFVVAGISKQNSDLWTTKAPADNAFLQSEGDKYIFSFILFRILLILFSSDFKYQVG